MIHKPDGFPEQRRIVLTDETKSAIRCKDFSNQSYISEIGHFPRTNYHYMDRPKGTHDYIVILNISGTGFCRILDKVIKVPSGHILLIPPRVSHHYGADDTTPWNIYWMHINGILVDTYMKHLLTLSSDNLLLTNNTEEIIQCFEICLSIIEKQNHNIELEKNGISLQKLLSTILLSSKSSNNTVLLDSEDRIVKTINWMQKNIESQPSLKELAQFVHLSVPHFSALFKQQTGASPLKFYTRLKMQKACEILLQTKKPINEVSTSVGYEDPFYFCRMFKKVIGVPPLQYRKFNRPNLKT